MTSRTQRAAWAAVPILGVLLAFAPAVLGLRTLSQKDTDRIYAPLRALVVESLRDGRLPLWNPYEGTGKPLFAEGIHSVLHPVSLLGAALAPSSIDFLILAYLVAAAMGAFVLARTLDASQPASAGAGLAYALSGYSVSMTGNLVFLAGLSSLPWLLAAARAAGAGSPWGAALTALATGCAFLSGDAQVALVGLALGLLLAADAGGARGAGRASAGMLAGLLVAAVQLAATRELLPLTYRALELPPAEQTQWSLAPLRLLEWVVPGLFRGPLELLPRSSSGAPIASVFAESVFLGAPLLLVAGAGALAGRWTGRDRTGLLLAGAGAVLLWLALGHHLGARQLLSWVPVWSRFRYSEKLMAPLTLCIAALGALGIDALGKGQLGAGWRRTLAAGAILTGAVLAALSVAPDATAGLASHLLGDAGAFYRSTLAAGLPHLLVALAALLALGRIEAAPTRTLALSLLVALAPAAAVYRGSHLGDHDLRLQPTPLRLETDSPAPRIAHPAEKAFPRSGDDYLEINARVSSILLYPPVNAAHRIDAIEPYGAFQPLRFWGLATAFGAEWARALRRLGLTHVVLPIPWDDAYRDSTARAIEGGALTQRDERARFEVWAVPHRPWAFFAQQALQVGSAKRARDAVVSLVARGDDGTVVLETTEPVRTAPGRVLRAERGRETLWIEAESSGPAILVLQDAYWPGWRASIDGRPAEILAADHVVRAVRWPPGHHRLEMTYDPPEIRTGLALSAVGALAVLLLAALGARRRFV